MMRVLGHQLMVLVMSLITLTLFTFCLTLFFPDGGQLNGEASHNLAMRYWHYINQLATGDWGFSRISGRSVLAEFVVYFPATLELSLTALAFALILGLWLGVFAAQNKNRWPDKFVVSTTLVGYSMPIFWWGMLLVLLFSLTLGLTPVASRIGFEYDILPVTGFMLVDTLLSKQPYAFEAFLDALNHLILPTLVLATVPLAIFTRVTRSAMIEALASDYVRTAKAKGLPMGRIVWRHALRNALLPLVTVIGLQLSVLITGTLITETIFAWPGVGKWLLEAVHRRDLITLHGGLLIIAVMVVLTNILVEIISHFINPKLRRSR